MTDKPLQLLIHGGLNKAGSSYLQGVFHANSEPLRRAGISYLGGGTMSGNAQELSMAIRARNIPQIKRFFENHTKEARARGCDRVLISAEYLYHDLILQERLTLLRELSQETGLGNISVLLFFRDPVSHAISAYCHRSGHQDIGTFPHWVREGYEFPRELRRFLSTLEEAPEIDWHPRAYTKGGLVDDTCKWMGVEAMRETVSTEVNVSVSVDEAEILGRLRTRNVRAARALRQALKDIPRARKADDSVQRARYSEIAAQALSPLTADLERLSALVGADLTVAPPEPDGRRHHTGAVKLSADQIDAVLAMCAAPPERFGVGRLARGVKRRLKTVSKYQLNFWGKT